METLIIAGKEVRIKEFELKINGIMREYWDILSGINSWESKSSIVRKYLRQKNNQIKGIKNFIQSRRDELTKFFDAKTLSEEDYVIKLDNLAFTEVDLINKVKSEIPPNFFYESTWKLLVKRGIWPFKKPFRSYRQMMKNAERPEMMNAIKYIGEKVLGYKTNIDELPEKKSTN
ncbi:MAG TPA: hypothetical protein DCO75_01450 [Fibrobacteres bacterium]|jgi:hypothetical protein|nr:hypothetical protein [Fibrobacterota bacterium]